MKYIFLFFTILTSLTAQPYYIDTVYSFQKGKFLEYQDSINPYYPNNIFGRHSSKATKNIPETSQQEILSIGLGGEIIVGFKDYIITDGPGIDFIIFENAFINPINQGIFAEPAIISVSYNGIDFIEFPYDSTTLKGLAGITPTNGKVEASKYPACGGDGFDLSTIGLDKVKYIKIKDISSIISTLDESNIYYNPESIISGFDLDAVAGINLAPTISKVNEPEDDYNIFYNNNSGILNIYSYKENNFSIRLFNLMGQVINSSKYSRRASLDISELLSGIYWLVISDENYYKVKKIIK